MKALAGDNTSGATDHTGPGNWGGNGNRAIITDAVIQQAQSILAPDQVSALKQLQSEQQAQQQVREMMRATPRT